MALVARGDDVDVATAGLADLESGAPMTRETLFRIASLTKPVTAAAVLVLVEDGVLDLDAPIARWLPELADPVVVRTPGSPLDDVVPAARPITVADVLESRAGWGFPDDFSLPAVAELFGELGQGPPAPRKVPPVDDWLALLARIPLLHQPGAAWLYNTCSDLQGVLVARASGLPLPEFLADRLFGPLGMRDTGFSVPPADLGRFTTAYKPAEAGFEAADPVGGQWSEPPVFPSGAGGLVSTADDLHAFARMLLSGGGRVLTAESVHRMTTDHLTAAQRAASTLFLEGQGWGYGGSVDVAEIDPWNVPGRYGWVGGTGTTAHVVPATGAVHLLFTQVSMTGPTPFPLMREFWRYAATH